MNYELKPAILSPEKTLLCLYTIFFCSNRAFESVKYKLLLK